ncbi:MAG: hypothetical protein HQL69_20885 [Magnetococcales bacterium]|nr:hypothetical protein [Magnetococcales bacterium]
MSDMIEKNWELFERLVLALFNHYFEGSQIIFDHTVSSGDGGKDGVAQFEITAQDHVIPGLPILVWLEAKYRTKKDKLNEYDIGGNIIIALFQQVHGLYVVTNREFTERSITGITTLGQRLNCQIYFIGRSKLLEFLEQGERSELDGKRLREFLNQHTKDYTASQIIATHPRTSKSLVDFTVRVRFTGSIESLPTPTPPQTFSMALGEPYFVSLQIVPHQAVLSAIPELQVVSKHTSQLTIFPYHKFDRCLTSPSGYQAVYLFTAINTQEIQRGFHYDILLSGVPEHRIHWDMPQHIIVKDRLNIVWTPPSWKESTTALSESLDNWVEDRIDGLLFSNIVAVAGYGKSFLVKQLRHHAIKRSVKISKVILPITIDCKYVDGPSRFVSILLSHLFLSSPDSNELLSTEHWRIILMKVLGLSSETAKHFMDWIQSGDDVAQFRQISSNEIARIVALMLREVSQKRKIFLAIEDMHKVDHVTFKMLLSIRNHLSSSSDSRIFFILTSRWGQHSPIRRNLQNKKTVYKNQDGSWADTLGSMIDEVDINANIFLDLFTFEETVSLLQSTVDGLRADQAERIIAQVGTSPFNLKETLLFLEESDQTIVRRQDCSGYRLKYGEQLDRKIQCAELEHTTEERLQLAKDYSEAVADLLDYGACLGIQFNAGRLDQILAKHETADLDDAFAYCERFDILKEPSFKPDFYEFSHDLLRDKIVDLLPSRKQRRIATQLLEEEIYSTQLEQAELCYQASQLQVQIAITSELIENHDLPARTRLVASLLQILALDNRTEWNLLSDIMLLNWNTAVRPQKRHRTTSVAIMPDQHEVLLASYASAIRTMRGITSSSNMLWERLASAGALLAREMKAHTQLNLFNYYTACHWYDAMQFQRAMTMFEQVEASEHVLNFYHSEYGKQSNILDKLLASDLSKEEIDCWVSEEGKWIPGQQSENQRQDNLLYLSFCHRHLANPESCLTYMKQALQQHKPGQWRVIGQALANTGALYLHSDLQMTRKFWQRGLDVMTCCGHHPYLIEFTINLAHLHILDNRFREAEQLLDEGELQAKKHGLSGQEIRASIHRGCLALKQEQFTNAIQSFEQALDEAITHHYERRLWRIRANLATLHEAVGDMDEAFWFDMVAVAKMAPITAIEDTGNGQQRLLWRITRASCALGNIGLRQMAYPTLYDTITQTMTPEQNEVCQLIAQAVAHDKLETIGGLAHFLTEIKGRKRFLITD